MRELTTTTTAQVIGKEERMNDTRSEKIDIIIAQTNIRRESRFVRRKRQREREKKKKKKP